MYDLKHLQKFPRLGELAPEAFKAFVAFDKAVMEHGVVPLKYKELMAVAVARQRNAPIASKSTPAAQRKPVPRSRSWPRPP